MKTTQTLRIINLIAGVCLLAVALIEVLEERETVELEIEHGLLIYAIAHVLNKGIEFYEGVLKIHEHRKA